MDGAVGQAAGTGELDVVGAQHLQHLGTHQAQDQGELEDRQRDGRQDDVQPAIDREQARAPPADLHRLAAAEAGQPAQPNREHQDQQNADQERRQRHTEQREGHEHLAQEVAALERRVDPHRHPDQQGQRGGHQRQLEGGGKAFAQQARHLGTQTQAQPEFTLHRIGEEMPELHDKGLVQPQIGAQGRTLSGRGVLAEQEHHRIPDVLEQQERHKGDRHHDQDGLNQAAEKEGTHGNCKRDNRTMLAEQERCQDRVCSYRTGISPTERRTTEWT